ncbi:hypothetical protein CEXT_794611 [Caerostris extrusa]|uniref:Uncharacterized protein n=1 Tax=Caerostris extrusa TaxID=172846 RepID=A0AAV4Y296_CAEEX|nr:hypothetical protein CEXT_794611 [Caerostris extrusa]
MGGQTVIKTGNDITEATTTHADPGSALARPMHSTLARRSGQSESCLNPPDPQRVLEQRHQQLNRQRAPTHAAFAAPCYETCPTCFVPVMRHAARRNLYIIRAYFSIVFFPLKIYLQV